MDDLLGEDWQKPAKPSTTTTTAPLNPTNFASQYASLRASPAIPQSGTASPHNISRPSSTLNGAAKPAATGDQFGNLLSLKSQKSANTNISIQERQRQLIEEKRRQQEQQGALWDTLGSGRGTPEVRGPSPALSKPAEQDEDDILAAFNRRAPVDKASHFPPPASGAASGRSTPAAAQAPTPVTAGNGGFDEDDDPFGLGSLPKQANGHAAPVAKAQPNDDHDILGDLARPVAEKPPPKQPVPRPIPEPENDFIPGGGELEEGDMPKDRALAELVEMGFPADKAKIALAESGGEVQAAVGWLLQQAHEESRQKAKGESAERRRSPVTGSRSPQRRPRGEQDAMPAWMRDEARSSSAGRRHDSRSPANGDKDAAQVAQEYGNKLFKGATSLWKASQKQMAKTMAEFQQGPESSQPKWMHDSSADNSRSSSQRRLEERPRPVAKPEVDVTDEAAMLDAPRDRPQKPTRSDPGRVTQQPTRERAPAEPLPHRPAAQPRFMQQAQPPLDKRPTTKLSRQDVEDQTAQAYVSPARRKKAAPKPEPQPEPEVDLFSSAPPSQPVQTSRPAPAASIPRPARAPTPPRPKAPPRTIPSVSPAALSSSGAKRKAGGEAFKRGDYATAHEAYTAALTPLPATHPVAIILYTNRALTGIKTGDAKTAVSDADQALGVIGQSQGIGETIDLGSGEGVKDMREFYGKAIMRKAEALEHLEKWSDAAAAWKTAVAAGVGGAVSLKGRDRCEKAAAPKPATKPAPVHSTAPGPGRPAPAKSMGNSLNRPALSGAQSAEAVKKLRAANAAADKADDEKFALSDQVDAKLTAWKGGKADNLRALLQSLDSVLWEAAGWKKVGMSDLVMPNKVKIVYMKAIAKVHPDKIPQDATTEQRMVSASVFSTLNEAWDKFKKDNNL
ncbi:UBA domain-containing protein 7 [Fulvia fulva]|uniref:UBA domain-containing protein 7 n=1 Tax=Passalora fulva TaxID=5499 RepID=A0A9Q8PB23_PASFU|nr:UBA domain-containing protein 7 [Fulvia fulva]KAK4622324.1 UBA domain-containing protein 7 [Fulvia fulva]KAK4622944.1 UBA domain-containing protein 7 [Fulvia fulva]UJO19191.1 UBA domain-containing protein 7 [Fulvia fulva]WPV16618.1 UBA domain-containing protein 7 [Fulvia fulva]WPV31752.1 UBA domain-containing protein 7 [Fulvia fulva]